MARATQPVEVTNFVAGLVTDASPLTFPDNASLDEENFVLNIDGSRDRRLGIDYENNFVALNSNQSNLTSTDVGRSAFKWENAGGDADKSLLVVQFGTRIDIIDLDAQPISSGFITSFTFDTEYTAIFTYAEVDGLLVVANGAQDIPILTYDGTTVTSETFRLSVRDMFGVYDEFDGEDLMSGSNTQTRPDTQLDEHIYNLRNQGWGVPRKRGNTETILDPIYAYTLEDGGNFPSNADSVAYAMYADPNDSDDRVGNRFFPAEVKNNPVGSTRAAQGHYIIDLFNRGASRLAEVEKSHDRYSQLIYDLTSLVDDQSEGGVGVVTEFAGRAWYAGFSGEVTNGDERSPRLSSYLCFSRLSETAADLARCYQEADPTSVDANELVDTDGGFVRIDGAYGIQGLVNIGSKLVILARNGVWILEGGSDYGFSATAYKVSRISEHGIRAKNSIVIVDNTVMFWGSDGIYHVTANEFGDTVVNSLTQTRIQTFYEQISESDKVLVSGYFDTYEKKVRWLYQTSLNDTSEVKELVLDVNLGAFYKNTIKQTEANKNKPVMVVEGNAYTQNLNSEDVVAGVDDVEVGGDQVVVTTSSINNLTRELIYITATEWSTTIRYSIATYSDTDFLDWKSDDDTGVDAAAFLLTGWMSAGDYWRDKQVPYLQTIFERTETGFAEDGDDFVLQNQSSCMVQAQWGWTDNANAGRWSTAREYYRLTRLYLASLVSEGFENGHPIVITKDRLRGRGKVVSLKFSTSPGKDCKLQGWTMLMAVENAPRR